MPRAIALVALNAALTLAACRSEIAPVEILELREEGVATLDLRAPGGGDIEVRAGDVDAVEITAKVYEAATFRRTRDGDRLVITHDCPPEFLNRTLMWSRFDPDPECPDRESCLPYCYVSLDVVVPRRLGALRVETATGLAEVRVEDVTELEVITVTGLAVVSAGEVDALRIAAGSSPTFDVTVGSARLAELARGPAEGRATFAERPELLSIDKSGYGVLTVEVPRGAYDLEVPPAAQLTTQNVTRDPDSLFAIRLLDAGSVALIGR